MAVAFVGFVRGVAIGEAINLNQLTLTVGENND